ncbi:hypothetical protein ACT9ST_16490 [Sphingobium limneticum]
MAATASVGEERMVLLMGAAGLELRGLRPLGLRSLFRIGEDRPPGKQRNDALLQNDFPPDLTLGRSLGSIEGFFASSVLVNTPHNVVFVRR